MTPDACQRCGGSFYLAEFGTGFVNGSAEINGVFYGDICCACWNELTHAFFAPCVYISPRGTITNQRSAPATKVDAVDPAVRESTS